MASSGINPTNSNGIYARAEETAYVAAEQLHRVFNGTAEEEVQADDGLIPSVRKALVDNFYFLDPIAWEVDVTESVFNQPRVFTNPTAPEDVTYWFAPAATSKQLIPMGGSPFGDDNWQPWINGFDKGNPLISWAYTAETLGQTVINVPFKFKVVGNVFINGVHQNPDEAYKYDKRQRTVTLSQALDLGDTIVIQFGMHGGVVPSLISQLERIKAGAEAAELAAQQEADRAEVAASNAADEFSQQFQDRFNTLAPIQWTPNTLIEKNQSLQVFEHAGIFYLPNVKLLPFTTGATFNTDNWILSQINTELKTFESLQDAIVFLKTITYPVNSKVKWMGYWSQSDGGSGWGVVKSGNVVGDGGSKLRVNGKCYIEQNFASKINVKKFGAKGVKTDDNEQLDNAINYARLLGKELKTPEGQYGVTTGIDISGVKMSGVGFLPYREDKGSWIVKLPTSNPDKPAVRASGVGWELSDIAINGEATGHTRGLLLIGDENGQKLSTQFKINNVYIYGNWDDEANIAYYAYGNTPSNAIYYGQISNLSIEHAGTGFKAVGQYNANQHGNLLIRSCRKHIVMDGLNQSGCIENIFSVGFFGTGGDALGDVTALTMRNGARLNVFTFTSETSSGGKTFNLDDSSKNNTFLGYSNESVQSWVEGWINQPIKHVITAYQKRSDSQFNQLISISERAAFDSRFGVGASGANTYDILTLPVNWGYSSNYSAFITLTISSLGAGAGEPFYAEIKFGLGKRVSTDGILITKLSTIKSTNFDSIISDVLFVARDSSSAKLLINYTSASSLPAFSFTVESVYTSPQYYDIESVGLNYAESVIDISSSVDVAAAESIMQA